MKVPVSWLREYVRTDATAQQIADALSIATAEVNGVTRLGVTGDLSLFRVGRVLEAAKHPNAEFLIHPECGCATSAVEAVSAGDVDPEGVQILSTEGMINRPKISDADEYIVATEVGILHRSHKTTQPIGPHR